MATLDVSSVEKDPRRLADVIRQLAEGKSNAVGTTTLTPSVATTVVNAPTCSPTSLILLSPQTANAAAALATTWIISGTGQFTIHHANNVQVDRTFGWFAVG